MSELTTQFLSAADEIEEADSTSLGYVQLFRKAANETAQLEADNTDLRSQIAEAREGLELITKFAMKWDANKLGNIQLQRKRWLRLGAVAAAYLAKSAMSAKP